MRQNGTYFSKSAAAALGERGRQEVIDSLRSHRASVIPANAGIHP